VPAWTLEGRFADRLPLHPGCRPLAEPPDGRQRADKIDLFQANADLLRTASAGFVGSPAAFLAAAAHAPTWKIRVRAGLPACTWQWPRTSSSKRSTPGATLG
jgi:hypothetical protein